MPIAESMALSSVAASTSIDSRILRVSSITDCRRLLLSFMQSKPKFLRAAVGVRIDALKY